MDEPGTDLKPLFEAILNYVPCPEGDPDEPLQLLVSTIDYNDYVGRIGIGRVERGTIRRGMMAIRSSFGAEGETRAPERINTLYTFQGLNRIECESATVGEIVAVSGMPDINIGDTMCPPDAWSPCPLSRFRSRRWR